MKISKKYKNEIKEISYIKEYEDNNLEDEIDNELQKYKTDTFNPDVTYVGNKYWETEFKSIYQKPFTQRAAELINNFNNFLSQVHNEGNNNKKKMDFVKNYFIVFEYVFDSLSAEFKLTTMQKLLENLNITVKSITTINGEYKNVYIGRYSSEISSELGITSIFENFQNNILFTPKYKHIFDDIKKTSKPDNTKNIIQTMLYNLPIDISKKWIDNLWSKEEQKLSYINLKPLARDNNQAFSYLVSDFKGWNDKNSLAIFFEFAYLGQSNIEQLEKNIGKIATQVANNSVDILLKRNDLSDSGKIDILKTLFTDLSDNLDVFNFISDYLLNGSNQKDIFEKNPFNFSQSLQKHLENIKKFEKFHPQINKLIKANLIDFNELNGVPNLLINLNTSELINLKVETLIALTKLTEQKINLEEKENILFKLFEYGNHSEGSSTKLQYFFALLDLWKSDLDIDKFSNNLIVKIDNKNISSEIVGNYDNFCSYMSQDFNDSLFLHIFNNKNNRKKMYPYICGNSLTKKSWYENVFKHNKGWEFCEDLLDINDIRKLDNANFVAEQQIMIFNATIKYLNDYRPDKTFILSEENPLFININKIIDYLEYGLRENKITLNSSFGVKPLFEPMREALGILINDLFDNKLIEYVDKDNKGLTDILTKLGITSKLGDNFYLSILPKKNENPESFSFFSFFRNKEKIVPNLAKVLTIKNKELIFSNDLEQILIPEDGLNKSEFIHKAQKEYIQIKNYLDSVKEKPLNLEVKIKSNNLMLDYINFVTLIDSAKSIVGMEDMHFLENNLGSYLLESLRSYTKNVERYDIMQKANDSGNFKRLFSGKTEEDIQKLKERSDNECLRWIKLLEEQLELVKKNVIEQLNDDSLNDMKVRSRFLTARFPATQIDFPTEKLSAIKIR